MMQNFMAVTMQMEIQNNIQIRGIRFNEGEIDYDKHVDKGYTEFDKYFRCL